MLFSQILKTLVIRSGQYILGGSNNFDALGITINDLWFGLNDDIIFYERYFPLKKQFNINVVQAANSANLYDFTYDVNNVGYSLTNPQTLSVNQDLAATPTQTFTLTLPSTPVSSGSVSMTINGTPACTDSTPGTLVFGAGFSNYSGTIDYLGGVLTITVTEIVSPVTIAVVVSAQYATYGEVPFNIAKIVPCGFRQVYTNWFLFFRQRGFPTQMGRTPTPRALIPDYRPPFLYLSEPGEMDIEALYTRQRVMTLDPDNPQLILDVDIVGLDHTKLLLDLLLARFLILVGTARSSFEYADLPISTNADKLIQMGEKMLDDAQKEIYGQQEFWRALRP